MSTSHQREAAIFDAAMELPPEQRAAYLNEACGKDAALRRRVESLVSACESQCIFLDSPAPEVAESQTAFLPVSEKPGDTIGRYKLLEQIGEGGCGVVYVAEQTQPVRRRVALKIIKLGMDTKSVVARFEAERQALAMMDHPNIAKVFDASATETGRPYFVMELVRGMKITAFCDEKKFSTKQRLDLFVQVCHAIQHAHQKGIIHRDIKPSNILVTVNDGVPVPKVIDFGIAKATAGQRLSDKTIYTAFEQFIGTPAYMSPEQAVLTSLDIDTRSDIYALGVLLYELLTGCTPFDPKELLAIGFDEMRRTIREQEPPRPSTCLSTLAGQELSTTAQRRGLDAPKLVSELRGDLDWIVMKAMEKDRTRRYETASGLAADLQRHLNNEPVLACPPSGLYRLGKLIRRNKVAFAASATVAFALIAGTIVSTWQAARAQRAERAAKTEADSAEAVLQFFRENVIAAGRPEGMAGGLGKDVTLRQALDAAESKITDAFKDRPAAESSIRKSLGQSYIYLGEPVRAVPQLERALKLREEELGIGHQRTVDVMDLLRPLYKNAGRAREPVPFYKEALRIRQAKFGPHHSSTLSSMDDLALAHLYAGDRVHAIRLFEETLKLRQEHLGPTHGDTLISMDHLAAAYASAGRHDDALRLYEQTLTITASKSGNENGETLRRMNTLAVAYEGAGKAGRALPLYEKLFEFAKAKMGQKHPTTLVSMFNLASAYEGIGNSEQAVVLLKQTLQLRRAILGEDHHETLRTLQKLANAYANAERRSEAISSCEEALKILTAKLGRDHRDTLFAMNELAYAYYWGQQRAKMLPLAQEALKLSKAKLDPDDEITLVAMNNLGLAYQDSGNLEQAIGLFEEALQLSQEKRGPYHARTVTSRHNLGLALADARQWEQAIPLLEEAVRSRKADTGLENRLTLDATRRLAMAYRDSGDLDRALTLFEELLTLNLAVRPSHEETLRTRQGLGKTLILKAERPDTAEAQRSRDLRRGEKLMREHLAGARSFYTNNPVALASSIADLAEFRYRRGDYAEAEGLYRETIQLRRTKLSVEHKDVIDATASLARLLSEWVWAEREGISDAPPPRSGLADRAHEAERLLRDVLALRLRENTNSWRVGDVQSRLGGALVSVAITDANLSPERRAATLTEAESLLLEGHARLQKQSNGGKYISDAARRLVHLYEAWKKSDKRSEWQNKLEVIEKAVASSTETKRVTSASSRTGVETK